jgi:hypothetical protein
MQVRHLAVDFNPLRGLCTVYVDQHARRVQSGLPIGSFPEYRFVRLRVNDRLAALVQQRLTHRCLESLPCCVERGMQAGSQRLGHVLRRGAKLLSHVDVEDRDLRRNDVADLLLRDLEFLRYALDPITVVNAGRFLLLVALPDLMSEQLRRYFDCVRHGVVPEVSMQMDGLQEADMGRTPWLWDTARFLSSRIHRVA